jgi:hypothetical protein
MVFSPVSMVRRSGAASVGQEYAARRPHGSALFHVDLQSDP